MVADRSEIEQAQFLHLIRQVSRSAHFSWGSAGRPV